MKIYLDNCCLNRPFDDQSNHRNRLESEAVKTILLACERKMWQLISSEVIDFEIASTPDENRRNRLELIGNCSVSRSQNPGDRIKSFVKTDK